MIDKIKEEFKDTILGIAETNEKEPVFDDFYFYNKEINDFLINLGIKLYRHQKLALENLYSGKNVVITTPTASGKSEVFRLYILDNLLSNPLNTYLLIYPTRALLYDQYEKLLDRFEKFYKILKKDVNVKVRYILGDLSYKEKEEILKEKPNIILTTIDNLHLFLLKNHDRLFTFFKNLDLIVVDEVHTYRGVFGTNAAYVFRRLFRLLKYLYKNRKFKVLALSATLANSKQFCEKLFDLEFEEISEDYSKQYKKTIIVIDPKGYSPRVLLKRMIRILLENNIKSLVFLESKKGVELSKIAVMDIDKEGKVHPYKASLLRDVRREIEKKFKEGEYLILITTSALELGIDIGDVKAVVNYGIPRDGLFSLIQRFGRAGRASEGYNIIIFKKDALDFYYSLNIEELFSRLLKNKVDEIPINLNNENVIKRHLLYSIYEFSRLPEEILSEREKEILINLEKEGKIKKIKDPFYGKYYYVIQGNVKYVGLRNIGERVFYLLLVPDDVKNYIKRIKKEESAFRISNMLKAKGYVIEEMDEYSFYEYLLPGMVYYSLGKSYRIEDFHKVGNITFVFAREEKTYAETYTLYNEDVKILDVYNSKVYKDWTIYFGKIKVRKTYVGYLEKYKVGEAKYQNINYYVEPIEHEFVTEAIWIVIPESYREVEKYYFEYFKRKLERYLSEKKLSLDVGTLINLVSSIDKDFLYERHRGLTTKKVYEIIDEYLRRYGIEDKKLSFLVKKILDSYYSFQSGLHAIEHNIIKISPVVTNVDSRELGGYSYPIHQDTGKPTIFIYEGYENGVGLAKILFENIEKLIEKSKDSIYKCKCLDNCPRCVLSTKCGNFNEYLDKHSARFIYRRLFKYR